MDDWLTIFLQNCQGLLDVTKRRDLLLRKKCKKKKTLYQIFKRCTYEFKIREVCKR